MKHLNMYRSWDGINPSLARYELRRALIFHQRWQWQYGGKKNRRAGTINFKQDNK